MEDLFEDRGGHCLVAGEDSEPFLAELVGGEGDAAAALAIADPAEEEGGRKFPSLRNPPRPRQRKRRWGTSCGAAARAGWTASLRTA